MKKMWYYWEVLNTKITAAKMFIKRNIQVPVKHEKSVSKVVHLYKIFASAV